MKLLATTATVISNDALTSRWARKSPTRKDHYKRRFIFYAKHMLEIALVIGLLWLIASGYLYLKFGS